MANDELMDQWAAEDDALVPKPTAPIVPRVDKFVGEKRWGVDTPMFDSRDDLHSWLWDMGMAPGNVPADIANALLYLSEGEVGNAMLAGSAALPIGGIAVAAGRKGKGYIDKGIRRYGGKVQRGEELKRTIAESIKRDMILPSPATIGRLEGYTYKNRFTQKGIKTMRESYHKKFVDNELEWARRAENAVTLEKNTLNAYRPHIKEMLKKSPNYRFDAQGELMGQYGIDTHVKALLKDPKFGEQLQRFGLKQGPKPGWEVQDFMKANKISPDVMEYYKKIANAQKAGDDALVSKLIMGRKNQIESAMIHKGGEIYTKEIPTEGPLTMERRSKTPFDPGDYDVD